MLHAQGGALFAKLVGNILPLLQNVATICFQSRVLHETCGLNGIDCKHGKVVLVVMP